MDTILVWNEFQRVPATAYGDANFGAGKYQILVRADCNKAKREEFGGEALIYHFSGSSSGGAGGR